MIRFVVVWIVGVALNLLTCTAFAGSFQFQGFSGGGGLIGTTVVPYVGSGSGIYSLDAPFYQITNGSVYIGVELTGVFKWIPDTGVAMDLPPSSVLATQYVSITLQFQSYTNPVVAMLPQALARHSLFQGSEGH